MMIEGNVQLDGAVNPDTMVVLARSDSQALGALYERHYQRVFRYCLHRLFVKEAAADVTSAIFLNVAGHIRDFAGSTEADFRNWLYVISTRQCDAWIRSNMRRKELLEAAVAARRVRIAQAREPSPEEDWARLHQAICRLSPVQQSLVVLRFFEGLAYDEISAILGGTPAGLRVMMSRSLAKLRSMLDKSYVCEGE